MMLRKHMNERDHLATWHNIKRYLRKSKTQHIQNNYKLSDNSCIIEPVKVNKKETGILPISSISSRCQNIAKCKFHIIIYKRGTVCSLLNQASPPCSINQNYFQISNSQKWVCSIINVIIGSIQSVFWRLSVRRISKIMWNLSLKI